MQVGMVLFHDQKLKLPTNYRPTMSASAVLVGLYISLNQCSMSKGLEHRLIGVTISRQMGPKSD